LLKTWFLNAQAGKPALSGMAEKKEENTGNMNAIFTKYRLKTLSSAYEFAGRKIGRNIGLNSYINSCIFRSSKK
jgi:hypothetical protein